MADQRNTDMKKHSQAITRATLRGCVAVYLCYLASQLVKGAGQDGTTMPVWASYLFAALLVLCAAAFGVYIWYRYRIDRAEAEIREDDATESPEGSSESSDGSAESPEGEEAAPHDP